jgi:hypothetical protein
MEEPIDIPLAGGLEEKTASRLVQPGAFIALNNMRFDRAGQLSQRYGLTGLSRTIVGGGTLSACLKIAGYRSELLLSTGELVYSYAPSIDQWSLRSRVSPCVIKRDTIFQTNTAFDACDVAYGNNVIVLALGGNLTSLATSRVHSVVLDAATKSPIRTLEAVDTASSRNARVFMCGTRAVIVYYAPGVGIRARTMTFGPAPSAWSAATTLASDTTSQEFDARPIEGHANRFALVYENNTDPAEIVGVQIWDASNLGGGAVTTDRIVETVTGIFGFAIHATDGDTQGYIAYSTDTGANHRVSYARFNLSTGVGSAVVNLLGFNAAVSGTMGRLGIGRISSSTAVVMWSPRDNIGTQRAIYRIVVNNAGSIISDITGYTTWRTGLLSRPFAHNSRTYVAAQLWSDIQSTNYLFDAVTDDITSADPFPMRCVGRFAVRIANSGSAEREGDVVSSVVSMGNSQFGLLCNTLAEGTGRYVLSFVTIDFAHQSLHQSQEYARSLRFVGGYPMVYEGQQVVEESFHYYPELGTVTMAGAAGSLSAGVYQYAACFRVTLTSGEMVRSAPSLVGTATAVANNTASVPVSNYSFTEFQRLGIPVVIELYRTVANGDAFFLVNSYTATTANDNDLATYTQTLSDGASDSGLTANLPLYSQVRNGVLENLCPPGLTSLIEAKGRLWGIGDDKNTIWYSDEVKDFEAPRWHEVQTINLGVPLTCLGVMDDKIVAFAEAEIYLLIGSPADRLGQGTLSFQRVSSAYGSISHLPPVLCDLGLAFQSRGGEFRLMSRNVGVEDFGLGASETAKANTNLTSNVSVDREQELRFTARPSTASSTGVMLVFDLERKVWVTRTFRDSVGPTNSVAIVSSVVVDGVHYLACGNGKVYKEDTTLFTDDTVFVEASFTLPWVQLGSIQGYQQCRTIRLLVDRSTAYDLECLVYFDSNETVAQTKNMTNASLSSLAQPEFSPARQKCQRIKLKVTTKTPSSGSVGTGQAASFQIVTFGVEKIAGMGRVKPSNRA